jgi:hypothetical protein
MVFVDPTIVSRAARHHQQPVSGSFAFCDALAEAILEIRPIGLRRSKHIVMAGKSPKAFLVDVEHDEISSARRHAQDQANAIIIPR